MALEGILKQTILKELLYYHMRPCVFLFAKIRKGPAQTCGVFILGHLKKFIFRYDSQIDMRSVILHSRHRFGL